MTDSRSSQDATERPARPKQQRPPDATGSGAAPRDANKYRDRPTEDGKQGDAAQEPNAGFPHDD